MDAWTPSVDGATMRAMPLLDLTDLELATAAQACRATALQDTDAG
jgi:hypothetical protein